jgi:transposase
MDIRHILTQLEMLNTLIAEIESEMEMALGRIPYSSKLLSIKGLGVVSVAGIIGEVGDFKKFQTRAEIMKLAGLGPLRDKLRQMERTAEDIKTRKEPAQEDTLLCGDPDHQKQRHSA